jgi:hypothetical protein
MNIAAGCWHPNAVYREAVAEPRDVVSAAELITHASPNRLSFVGADALLVPVGAAAVVGETITGAAFAEAQAQAPAALTVASGELVMTFVDDRLGGFLDLRQTAGALAPTPGIKMPEATSMRLADNTVIRWTGMIGAASRRVREATQLVGLPGASFATA